LNDKLTQQNKLHKQARREEHRLGRNNKVVDRTPAEDSFFNTTVSSSVTELNVTSTASDTNEGQSRRSQNDIKKKGPPPNVGDLILEFLGNVFAYLSVWIALRIFLRFAGVSRRLAPNQHRQQVRLQQQAQQARFQEWARRLNQQRQANGQQPLSAESLQLVLRGRELNGEDYDGLLQFHEEAGPALEALLTSMGATQQEIDRCPRRTLSETDDLLVPSPSDASLPHCAVCLEPYQAGHSVRTIPCFHSFHVECIDPWLSTKATCPVCKYPAVA
jgi:hypothetical protein